MNPEEYKKLNKVPDRENANIRMAVSALGLSSEAIYIDIAPDTNSIFGECFINVKDKVQRDGGKVIYGWRFYEFSYMIEAELHAVWESPDGKIIDITPGKEVGDCKILFAVDSKKGYDGTRIDNFRINTTENKLVDDMIEIERARFRFIDKAKYVDTEGQVLMNEEEALVWQHLFNYSYEIDFLFAHNGTVEDLCFCGSGKQYKDCHRIELHAFLISIK